ncbi:rCG21725 [Rattus norvegicus]|uniref:RCG21725 n=1 Tax=Rattus norvegicus TaxID=10116 RepID=A6J0E0_RAT|nr:rCG21725 [Rattus norvegicus]
MFNPDTQSRGRAGRSL